MKLLDSYYDDIIKRGVGYIITDNNRTMLRNDAVGAYAEAMRFGGRISNKNRKPQQLSIVNHTYHNGKTVIEWSDNTKTICRGNPETSDAYTGFMIALAKKFMGNKNKASNLADYWCVKIPKMREEAEKKAREEKMLEARREEKRKKRREQYRRRIAAIRLKEEYEAKKLASELYGIPIKEL